jgi:hypothetical protein
MRRLSYFVLCIALLLSACAPESTPTSVAPPRRSPMPTLAKLPVVTPPVAVLKQGKLKEVFPALANISQFGYIQIKNTFAGGPGETPPIDTYFLLERQADIYSTTVIMGVGRKDSLYSERIITPTVSLNIGQGFLQALIEGSVYEGTYRGSPERTMLHTSESIEITVFTPNGKLNFFSDLDGFGKPWTVWFGGRQYTTENDFPFSAYNILDDYLNIYNQTRELNRQHSRLPPPCQRLKNKRG